MSLAIDGELRSPDGWCAIFHGSAGRVDPSPDVFVYELGAADLLDHQLPNGQVAHLGEAVADARLADQIDKLARGTDDGAATRVFVELPDDPQIVRLVPVDATKPTARTTHEQEREAAAVDPPTAAAMRARIRRFNEILHEATERHDNVRVVPPLDDTPATWRAAIRAARD